MASYNELIALIDAFIKRNGVQAITGQILNGVLKAMVDQVGRGYAIMGVATPSTNPGTPDAPESWFASTPGTYTNFGGLEVADAEFALLSYTPSGEVWTKTTLTDGIQEVSASIDGNVGTPEVTAEYINGGLIFTFSNMKGQTGDAAGFGTVNATVDGNIGTPGVSVNTSGPDTAKNITFAFRNLKGETGVTSVVATVDNTSGTPSCSVSLVGQELHLDFHGLKGAQGDTGSSVDYPFTIVNNLTTNDATQALSAAQGVVLQGELSQLEAKVTDLEKDVDGNEFSLFNEGKLSAKIVPGEYVVRQTGAFTPYSGWSRTDFVNVRLFASVKITMSVASNYNGFYDKDKNFIGPFALSSGDNILVIPANVDYIVLSNTDAGMQGVVIAINEYSFAEMYKLRDSLSASIGANGGVVSCGFPIDFVKESYSISRDNTITNSARLIKRIELVAGSTLYVRVLAGSGTQSVVIAEIDASNNPVKICVLDQSAESKWYRYFAVSACRVQIQSMTTYTDSCYFVVNEPVKDNNLLALSAFFALDGNSVRCFRNGDFAWGTYINNANTIASSSSMTKTAPIPVTKGQIICLFAKSTGGAIPMIVSTNKASEDATSIYWHDPAYINRQTSFGWFFHKVEEDGFVILQSAKNNYNLETIAYIFDGERLGRLEDVIGDKGIVSYNPYNVFDNVVNQLKRPSISSYTLQTPPVLFGWISDIHGHEANTRRFLAWMSRYSVDDLLNTGDTASQNYSDGIDFWSRSGAEKVLNVVGNHDTSEGNIIATATSKQVYDMLIAPFVSHWGVIQPANASANGYNYYYKDYDGKSLRLIVLDAVYWDDNEKDWLIATLDSARQSGLSAVIATHYKPGNTSPIACSFNSLIGTPSEGVLQNSSAIQAVSDFIAAGGDFVCWLTGHTHIDLIGTINGHQDQLVITLENGGLNDSWNDSARVAGTKSQDSFNLIAFDVSAGFVKVARVGDDYDNALRHKVTMCYDYRNRRIIYCS